MRCCLCLRKCWYWFWDCRQSDKNSQQDKGKGMLEELAINDNNNICFAVDESSSFSWNLISRCSIKRNILDEGRMFNDEWFMKYFVVQQNERALCLICRNEVACLKKLNMKRNNNSRMLFCGELEAVKTYWKMPYSACLLSRKVAIETVRNFASADVVTLPYVSSNSVFQ